MSTLNQNTAECESIVHCLLELNLKVTSIMAFMNCKDDVHIENDLWYITLIDHMNNFQLLPPEIVENFIDLGTPENVQFIKQRSDKWYKHHKKLGITRSTLIPLKLKLMTSPPEYK